MTRHHRSFILLSALATSLCTLGAIMIRRLCSVRVAALTPYGNVVTRPKHVTLRRTDLTSGRTILVGDVHGCAEELDELLSSVEVKREDNIIFVGDLVNKGPSSVQVLDRIMNLECHTGSVRGNHDDVALANYHKLRRLGEQKVLPKDVWVQGMTQAHAQFLENLPFSIWLPAYGVLVVHAGLVPGLQLDRQRLVDLYKMRNVMKEQDSTRWTALEGIAEGEAWAAVWEGPEHVVFGHDARRGVQRHDAATGLDSGCVYGGQLTALVLPPLAELSSNATFQEKLQQRLPPTLSDLQARVVQVQAARAYSGKKST